MEDNARVPLTEREMQVLRYLAESPQTRDPSPFGSAAIANDLFERGYVAIAGDGFMGEWLPSELGKAEIEKAARATS